MDELEKALGAIGKVVDGAKQAAKKGASTIDRVVGAIANRVAEEYPLMDFPFNYLKSGYHGIKSAGMTTGADGTPINLGKKHVASKLVSAMIYSALTTPMP